MLIDTHPREEGPTFPPPIKTTVLSSRVKSSTTPSPTLFFFPDGPLLSPLRAYPVDLSTPSLSPLKTVPPLLFLIFPFRCNLFPPLFPPLMNQFLRLSFPCEEGSGCYTDPENPDWGRFGRYPAARIPLPPRLILSR